MQFIHHPACNGTLTPANGDEGKVDSLPVCRGRMGVSGAVRSYWIPTEEEIKLMQSGPCCIVFTILGTTHAPIRADVEMLPPQEIDNVVIMPGSILPN
jgi:hypothetical protein